MISDLATPIEVSATEAEYEFQSNRFLDGLKSRHAIVGMMAAGTENYFV